MRRLNQLFMIRIQTSIIFLFSPKIFIKKKFLFHLLINLLNKELFLLSCQRFAIQTASLILEISLFHILKLVLEDKLIVLEHCFSALNLSRFHKDFVFEKNFIGIWVAFYLVGEFFSVLVFDVHAEKAADQHQEQ